MPAMDPKILAAVFASIAAITVGTGGTGNIDSFQNLENIEPNKIFGNLNNPTAGFFKNFNQNPVPNNTVKITIKTGSEPVNLDVDSDHVELIDTGSFISVKKNISTDEDLTLKEYSGRITLDDSNATKFKGSSKGFNSSGVSYLSNIKLNGVTNAEVLQVNNVSREKISMKNVNFNMESTEGTSLENEDAGFKINSFSGNITYFKQNNSMVMNGDVDKFTSGGASFSG